MEAQKQTCRQNPPALGTWVWEQGGQQSHILSRHRWVPSSGGIIGSSGHPHPVCLQTCWLPWQGVQAATPSPLDLLPFGEPGGGKGEGRNGFQPALTPLWHGWNIRRGWPGVGGGGWTKGLKEEGGRVGKPRPQLSWRGAGHQSELPSPSLELWALGTTFWPPERSFLH